MRYQVQWSITLTHDIEADSQQETEKMADQSCPATDWARTFRAWDDCSWNRRISGPCCDNCDSDSADETALARFKELTGKDYPRYCLVDLPVRKDAQSLGVTPSEDMPNHLSFCCNCAVEYMENFNQALDKYNQDGTVPGCIKHPGTGVNHN